MISIDVQSNLSPYPSSGRQVMNVNEPNTAIADCLLFSPDGKSIISGWYCLYSETDRLTGREKEKERLIIKETDILTDRDGQADLQTERQRELAGRLIDSKRKTGRRIDRDIEKDRFTDRERQTDRQTYRQTGKQTRLSDLQREREREREREKQKDKDRQRQTGRQDS